MRLSEHQWEVAQRVCSQAQLQALDYWRWGYGYKRIGVVLELGRDSARGRIERAIAAIHRAQLAERAARPS